MNELNLFHTWHQLLNLNLNNKQTETFFFSFISQLLELHSLIGFDENDNYSTIDELPFEILLNINDWLKYKPDYSFQYDRFKNMLLNRFINQNELIDYINDS